MAKNEYFKDLFKAIKSMDKFNTNGTCFYQQLYTEFNKVEPENFFLFYRNLNYNLYDYIKMMDKRGGEEITKKEVDDFIISPTVIIIRNLRDFLTDYEDNSTLVLETKTIMEQMKKIDENKEAESLKNSTVIDILRIYTKKGIIKVEDSFLSSLIPPYLFNEIKRNAYPESAPNNDYKHEMTDKVHTNMGFILEDDFRRLLFGIGSIRLKRFTKEEFKDLQKEVKNPTGMVEIMIDGVPVSLCNEVIKSTDVKGADVLCIHNYDHNSVCVRIYSGNLIINVFYKHFIFEEY